MRIALPWATVAGFLTALGGILGWLFVIVAVFFAVRRYKRQQPRPLTGTEGVKLGVFISVISSAFFAAFFSLRVAASPAEFRAALDKSSQWLASHNLDPEGTTQAMFAGPRGMVLVVASTILFTSIVLVILGGISGVLAAKPTRDKPGS